MLYTKNIRQEEKEYDLIVCGGGVSGFATALAAAEEGLGTCWICAFERAKANAALGLTDGPLNVFALSPLGYAAAEPVPFVRKKIEDIAEIL